MPKPLKSMPPRFAVLLAAFGAIAANSATAVERAGASDDANEAVLALVDAAEQSLSAGQPAQAAILLERALRIEPRDAAAWHYLGRARLELGNFAQAEALAAKSHSLSVDDRLLRARNAELMAAAQQAAGKPVSVPSSEPPRSALQRLFAAEVEPARTYREVDDQPERTGGAEPRRGWPSADATALTSFAARSPGWRRLDDAYADGVRRARAAWRDEIRPRSAAVFDGRRYRRYGSDEALRRQR